MASRRLQGDRDCNVPKGAVLAAAASKDEQWIVHGDGQVVVVRNVTTYSQVLGARW